MMNFQVVVALLGLIFAANQLASAQVEEGSGSGDGSGDSDISCRRPEDPMIPSRREAAVVREVKCHLACIDEVSQW